MDGWTAQDQNQTPLRHLLHCKSNLFDVHRTGDHFSFRDPEINHPLNRNLLELLLPLLLFRSSGFSDARYQPEI